MGERELVKSRLRHPREIFPSGSNVVCWAHSMRCLLRMASLRGNIIYGGVKYSHRVVDLEGGFRKLAKR